jgi:hypothetical protein
MLTGRSDLLPGLYPLIAHLEPAQQLLGRDNLGIGHTQHGERFLLKEGGRLGAAEFIGAKVCDACGIPACQPTVVTVDGLHGLRQIFGSRLESGVHLFDQTSVVEWQQVLSQCGNRSAFSAMLAIDLVLGNDDRHWNNWLVQSSVDPTGAACWRLRGLDFSRSWPVRHPSQPPLQHEHHNTWSACKAWATLGVDFDARIFHETCVKIGLLNAKWLRRVALQPIEGIFLSTAEVDTLCSWWENHLKHQVIETIYSLEHGVRP